MKMASGKVVHGQVVLDRELPEGTSVTVLARDETFEATPELERMLLEGIGQCERGEAVPLAARSWLGASAPRSVATLRVALLRSKDRPRG